MKQNIQMDMRETVKAAEMIEMYGCYFLCLLQQGQVDESQIFKLYKIFNNKGYIDEECTVLKPASIMEYLTGEKYTVIKTDVKPTSGYAFYVEYWYNERTGLHHFKLPDWDSIQNSVTSTEGVIESYRVFYK